LSSINAHLHLQIHLIGCCHPQHGCQLHYHSADSILLCECSFISQQIWNTTFIMLVIFGIWIKIETSSAGITSTFIYIFRQHRFNFGSVTSRFLFGWVGVIPGGSGVSPAVHWLSRSGACLPTPLHLQHICRSSAAPFWQEMQLSFWLLWTIAAFLSISACIFLCLRNSTLRFVSFQSLAHGLFNRYCVFYIAAYRNPPLDILAIFIITCMLHCSNCTRPACLATVSDMLHTYQKSVTASAYEIRLLPLPYMLHECLLRCLNHFSSTLRYTYHETCQGKSKSFQQHLAQFHSLCRQLPLLNIEASHYGQLKIGDVAVEVQKLNITLFIDDCLHEYGFTHIRNHTASYSCSFRVYRELVNVHPVWYCRWLHWQHCGRQTSVCVIAVSQWVIYWMKHTAVGLIFIISHVGELFVQERVSWVEKERKMIMKRSRKTWGIYSLLPVNMEWILANFYILLKINPVAFSCR